MLAEETFVELAKERMASMRRRVAGVAIVSAAIWFSHWLWYEADIFSVLWHSHLYRLGQLAICSALTLLAFAARSLPVLEWTTAGLLCLLTVLHGFALLVVSDACFVPFLLTLEWGNIVIALAAALAFRPSVVLFGVTFVVGVAATRLRGGFDPDLSDHLVLALIYTTISISIRNYDTARTAAHLARQELQHVNHLLWRSDEARSRLFTNLSHDFRTPLALIDGDAQRIELDSPDGEARAALQRIRRNAQAMADLTDQLLQMAKLDVQGQVPEARAFSLAVLTKHVVSQFDGASQRGRFRIANLASADCGGLTELVVVADPGHVRRILHNLIGNAVRQFERGASEIHVELSEQAGFVVLDVKNDGPPIAAEHQSLIFERFASFDVSGSVASGIGLPLSRELAELNGGSVELCASAEVTVFRLKLPSAERAPEVDVAELAARSHDLLAAKHEGRPGSESSPASESFSLSEAPANERSPVSESFSVSRMNLLIIEDNLELLELLTSMLGHDFVISTATSVQAALTAIRSSKPDVVLADVMLPDGTGLELLEQLPVLMTGFAPPVVFLSAAADEALRVDALAKGASDFVLKPFNAQELRARLEVACRGVQELEQSLELQRQEFMAELHDGVNSALARAALLLEAAQRRQRYELVPLARRAVMQALDQARSLSGLKARDCVPLGAAVSELESAMRSALAGFDVTCSLQSSSDGTLPALTGVEHHTLGRLAIEACTNALKHGATQQIECSLTVNSGQVELRVSSDSLAKGERENRELDSGKGLMLAGARLDRLNGWIRSEPDAGGRWTLAAGFTGALTPRTAERLRNAQPLSSKTVPSNTLPPKTVPPKTHSAQLN